MQRPAPRHGEQQCGQRPPLTDRCTLTMDGRLALARKVGRVPVSMLLDRLKVLRTVADPDITGARVKGPASCQEAGRVPFSWLLPNSSSCRAGKLRPATSSGSGPLPRAHKHEFLRTQAAWTRLSGHGCCDQINRIDF